jgi:hypothetical protein
MHWSSSSSNERKSGVSGGVNNLLSQKLDGRHVMAYIQHTKCQIANKTIDNLYGGWFRPWTSTAVDMEIAC